MPELMFVVKSLIISIIVMICLQVKIGNTSLENSAHQWIQSSNVSKYLQTVSSGAVMAIRNAAKVTKDYISDTFGNDRTSQKAGRFNIEFNRSEKYKKEHAEKSDKEQ